MSLLAMAALGGVDKSADGIAAKIRREAEQAFQARLQEDAQAFTTSEREAGQEYATSERMAGQSFTSAQNEQNREHDTGLLGMRIEAEQEEGDKDRNWQSTEKQKDRVHALEVETQKLERALTKASGTKSDKSGETTRKAYDLLIEKKYELHDTLKQAGEDEAAAKVWSELQRLEKGMREAFNVNMPEPAAPTPDSIVKKALAFKGLDDTPENRDGIIAELRKDERYASFFPDSGNVGEANTGGEAEGLLGAPSSKPKSVSAPNPDTNPLLNPLASSIAAKDSERATDAKNQEKLDLARQRKEFAGDLDKSDMDLRKASMELNSAYKKIQQGAGDTLTAAQLARLHDIIERIKTSGITDAESTQAKAILDYIQSRS